jgi:DNA modification methylase
VTPFLQDSDFTLYCGEARTVLEELPSGSIHTCVTSPPYWGLREYGDLDDMELGGEPMKEQYVERLCSILHEVKRVLHPSGTLWLNIGDTYKFKQAQGIPWRVALQLQDEGWWLRAEIIWWKPDAMPESVKDRPGRDHETVFMLSKTDKAFYDIEAERVPHKVDGRKKTTVKQASGSVQHRDGERWPNGGRNIRTVWEIPTENNSQAHFAVFPKELARRCISLGTSEMGVCPECLNPWVRVVESEGESVEERLARQPAKWRDAKSIAPRSDGGVVQQGVSVGRNVERRTIDWVPTCEHDQKPVQATVLDPFLGSGTTAFVARAHGRACVGIELYEENCELIMRNTQQLSLLA